MWSGLRIGLVVCFGAVFLSACTTETPKLKDDIQLKAVSFSDLPGWQQDVDLTDALTAFKRTCSRITRRADSASMGGSGYAGSVQHWRPLCDQADALSPLQTRSWFESAFTPYQVLNVTEPRGLFTGYYEPSLAVRKTRGAGYDTPIYARPDDLVMVDLGAFREDLKGHRIAGVVQDGRLKPYADRAAIAEGALENQVEVLAWAKDPVAVFFLQIQGSGQGILPDGSALRLGYSAQNGHPYYAIGRELIKRGYLTRETVSLQTIRAWLLDNPDQAADVMNTNASYVFFRELSGPGPVGAAGAALTAGRSLAVDRKFHAMGVPMWLGTTVPLQGGSEAPLNRLMIAQDTGGAIVGPVRGDVFWGAGDEAEFAAGHMKQHGVLYVLLPNGL